MWSWLLAMNIRTTYIVQLVSEGFYLSAQGLHLLLYVLPMNCRLIPPLRNLSRHLLFVRPFYLFFNKGLFRLQATLEAWDVELDACFPWNSMSLCRRKFPLHSTPCKRIDRSFSMINLPFASAYRGLGWRWWLFKPPMPAKWLVGTSCWAHTCSFFCTAIPPNLSSMCRKRIDTV